MARNIVLVTSVLAILAFVAIILAVYFTTNESSSSSEENIPLDQQYYSQFENLAITTDDNRCNEIALKVIKNDNGNVLDAGIAAALCIGVVNSASSGIGGNSFLVFQSENVYYTVDGRSVAPLDAKIDMFSNSDESQIGGLASAIPSSVQSYYQAHQDHGQTEWFNLWKYSIDMLQNGFTVSSFLADCISSKHTCQIV